MPEGDWSFLNSRGERKAVKVVLPPHAYVVLKGTAAMLGMQVSTLAAVAVTEYTEKLLEERSEDLREFVAGERARARECGSEEPETSDGQPVQGTERT